MNTDRHADRLVCMAALPLVLAGCIGSSIEKDVRRVRELTRTEELAAVHRLEVDPRTAQEVHHMLEQPLDAETAIRIALLNNRELRARLRELGIARGRLVQAGLLPNPIVEAELLPERDTEVELRVEYELTHALLAPARTGVARADLEAARYAAARAVVETGLQVRGAFYMLQESVQRLSTAQRMLDAFAAGREAARALSQSGNIAAIDLATHEAAYERARVAVARLELEAAERKEALQRLLGLHGEETDWQAVGPLPELPETPPAVADMEARAIEQSLYLKELRMRLEATARRAGLTRLRGALPDVAVDVHALYGHPDEASAETDDDWRFGTGVSLTVPIFDREQGTAQAYEAELDALRERYYGFAIELRSVVRDARNRLVSAHARARQYAQVIVPAQRRVTEESVKQYNAMQLGVFQLLQARREQLEAELDYAEVLREYWTAAANAESAFLGISPAAAVARTATGFSSAGAQPAGGH